jgi:hypothetical protein
MSKQFSFYDFPAVRGRVPPKSKSRSRSKSNSTPKPKPKPKPHNLFAWPAITGVASTRAHQLPGGVAGDTRRVKDPMYRYPPMPAPLARRHRGILDALPPKASSGRHPLPDNTGQQMTRASPLHGFDIQDMGLTHGFAAKDASHHHHGRATAAAAAAGQVKRPRPLSPLLSARYRADAVADHPPTKMASLLHGVDHKKMGLTHGFAAKGASQGHHHHGRATAAAAAAPSRANGMAKLPRLPPLPGQVKRSRPLNPLRPARYRADAVANHPPTKAPHTRHGIDVTRMMSQRT